MDNNIVRTPLLETVDLQKYFKLGKDTYLHAVDGESVHDMYEKMGFVTIDTLYDYYLEW